MVCSACVYHYGCTPVSIRDITNQTHGKDALHWSEKSWQDPDLTHL